MEAESEQILKLIKEKEALLEGHFMLSSGLHSPVYVQCSVFLQDPACSEKAGRFLGQRFSDSNIQLVISPALGGIIIGHEVARVLGVRAIFAERVYSGKVAGKLTLRRGFNICKGERVLIVEDVITTGGSTGEIISAVGHASGEIAGVACLIDRSSGKINFGCRTESLLRLNIRTYNPENCELCKRGIPLRKPGSRIY